MNTKLKYRFLLLGVILIVFSIYWFNLKSENYLESNHQNEVYTCSMHPEIIRDKPGNCPICGMFLVKKVRENHPVEDSSVGTLLKSTDNFIVGNFETTVPKATGLSTEIKLPGIVAYDPNSSVSIAARISGRIERLYVNYKYQKVNKGQKLFDLYSPELLTEQQNFVYLISNDSENIAIVKASKQKLLLYGMTESQINSLVSTKRVNPILSIYTPASGIIQGTESMNIGGSSAMKNTNTTENLTVKEGDYIKKNLTVFKLLNTDKVWGIFNVVQSYSSLIKIKQPIKITTEFDENEMINANINFIETQLNPADKTNRIRVYLNNSNLKLPIGLRLEGVVKTNPTKGIWIRKQAFVSLGNKKIVFKKMGNGFKATVLKTGIEIDDFIQVINGISIHDTIAKNGSYLIDSESFVKTK